MKKIGILSTCEHYEWAGTEEVWYHFAERALADGHQVLLGAHSRVASSTQVGELISKGLELAVRSPSRPLRYYAWKERFRSEMRRLSECDVVLVNAGSLYDALNLPWIGRTIDSLAGQGIPVIYFCHFCAESLPATAHCSSAIESFVANVSRWVFVSEHNHQLAQRQLATHFDQADVVMNGPRLNLPQPLPMPEPPMIFGCVARLETRWKGHDALLECLAEPKWKDRDWHLNLYGSGPDEEYVRRLIDHYQLNDRVTMRGYVRNMQEVWQECHIKVLASHGEGTPLAVLEAMMCGRATITTDAGGNHEILRDGETGFIADAATPRSFGAVLERAWGGKNEWQRMGSLAHVDAKRLAGADPAGQLLKLVIG